MRCVSHTTCAWANCRLLVISSLVAAALADNCRANDFEEVFRAWKNLASGVRTVHLKVRTDEITHELWQDGMQIRVEKRGNDPDTLTLMKKNADAISSSTATDWVSITDGTSGRTLCRASPGGPDHPSGFFHDRPIPDNYTGLGPISWWLRPEAVLEHLRQVEHPVDVSERGIIMGEEHVIVKQRVLVGIRDLFFENSYWVDPKRDYIIRRHVFDNGQTSRVMDVEYGTRDSVYMPVRWTETVLVNDTIVRQQASELIECTIGQPSDAERFVLEFLPGTIVNIDDKNTGTVGYLVRSDGRKRFILPHEARVTYEEMVAEEHGSWWHKAIAIGVLATAIAIVVIVFWRRRTA